MNRFGIIAALGIATLSAPAVAQDVAAGEKLYSKCKACHSIVADDGAVIVRGGRTGPNMFGIVGSAVASDPDFKYGESILAVGAAGAVWDEASLIAYLTDPKAWLVEKTGDGAAKSKMSFKLADGGADLVAYLASVAQ